MEGDLCLGGSLSKGSLGGLCLGGLCPGGSLSKVRVVLENIFTIESRTG